MNHDSSSSDAPGGQSDYVGRHIGIQSSDHQGMLDAIGVDSIESLMVTAIPNSVRLDGELELDPPMTEAEIQSHMRDLASKNQVRRALIGQGYYPTVTPSVIRRNVLENPAWYTAYTPYQPEISQGRLEALLVFQTMVADLTGLEIANASLLDEPTAAAEAMTLAKRASKTDSQIFVVDSNTHPQTLAVLQTRAEPLGIELHSVDLAKDGLPESYFGVLVSYPGSDGSINDWRAIAKEVHNQGAKLVAATDLLACTLLRPPGEWGADIVVGSAQRFGVPMGFGGPHAGFIAVVEDLTRSLPGRLVGVSQDAQGHTAYRLALQTREQHIRRERATSNICTSQVLLAVISGIYAAYHGPSGLTEIAKGIQDLATEIAQGLEQVGLERLNSTWFDTVTYIAPGQATSIVEDLYQAGFDVRLVDEDSFAISTYEGLSRRDAEELVGIVSRSISRSPEDFTSKSQELSELDVTPCSLSRTSEFLTHPWFSKYQSETSMMRWLRRMSDSDLALDRSMIPLGSCTMKLNAATAMEPISWPEFANIHPFAPASTTKGYQELIASLEQDLATVTGYDAVSIQPNAGSQGELAGLLAIRAYHRSKGEESRTVCLIPSSAHGTNAASAVMAGMKVVVVNCDDSGGVDLEDLKAKIAQNSNELAAVMLTYPSTYGVYDETIGEVCSAIHDAGGQVYVDGANLNALLGYSAPGKFGADVSHLNLHKTFCIPHGGGGPGVGPVGVREHLSKFLPSRNLDRSNAGAEPSLVGQVSGAPQGSAGILPIPYAYIKMMGAAGLKAATSAAVLSANYVVARLRDHYPVLYTGEAGLVAHECILDLRDITKATQVTVDDVAKRLIDYGFHAPTMSFPIPGTLMVEPTESEDLAELDRFCDAMINIRHEIDLIEQGESEYESSMLHLAPHTAKNLLDDSVRAYSGSEAAFPAGVDPKSKYWPPVSRIDGAYGDRNLICSCPPVSDFVADSK